MNEPAHMPVKVSLSSGERFFCEVCGVKWPCLVASERAIQRARESPKTVSPSQVQSASRPVYHETSEAH